MESEYIICTTHRFLLSYQLMLLLSQPEQIGCHFTRRLHTHTHVDSENMKRKKKHAHRQTFGNNITFKGARGFSPSDIYYCRWCGQLMMIYDICGINDVHNLCVDAFLLFSVYILVFPNPKIMIFFPCFNVELKQLLGLLVFFYENVCLCDCMWKNICHWWVNVIVFIHCI